MAEERKPNVLLLVIVTNSVVLFCNCKLLDGYAFPVYTTESCPRNLTEWRERSSVLNCTQTNAYMCVPNENITALLEFCYSMPQIQITKGLCMFLYKHHSILDAYDCRHFIEGCPNASYRSQDVHKYQRCVYVANGCFLADPICFRSTTIHHLTNRTTTAIYNETKGVTKHKSADLVWMATLSGVTGMIFIAICIFGLRIINKSQGSNKATDVKVDGALLPFIEEETHDKEMNGQNEKSIYYKHEGKLSVDEQVPQGEKLNNQFNQSLETDELGLSRNKTHENWDNKIHQEGIVISSLIIACDNGNYDIVQNLLKQGEEINALDEDGYCPLTIACYKGYDNIVELLLGSGANINLCVIGDFSPLYIACTNGHLSTVKVLLNYGAKEYINLPENDGATPLYTACSQGHDTIVELLIDNGADINYTDETGASPLCIACFKGHESIVNLLLTNGADFNLCNNYNASPLLQASEQGHDNIAKLLLKKGANINLNDDTGTSPLFAACTIGHCGTVQLLLDNGAEINSCSNGGASPLYIACENGHDSIVQLLLSNDADIHLCVEGGFSPLYVACQNGHCNTLKLLLEKGGNINVRTDNGYTLLQIATSKDRKNIVKILTENSAEIT